ncbi:hypothetical protein VP1G_04558 [Cytospora mali]|uniref:Luciferase domain-containing protein n=1 Tax=Cytospora mali TaxID=578113 RepID=A0A194UZT2_CYTMA|nr:hypothetical protein VP1G_04558 [Valsa mali var. pyri (nom. inval.)]
MSSITSSQTQHSPITEAMSESPSPESPRLGEKSLILGSSADIDALPALNMVIRQDPFSMTLDANALLAGSLFLLMGMHFIPRYLLESFILAVPVLLLIRNDYQNFLRLGPGGTPPTLSGYARLAWEALSRLAYRRPDRYGTARSCIEKHGFALFARHPVNVCGNGEVCHMHNSDRSMHMNLHPDDIAEVLAKGWGQRHPMAWGSGVEEGKGKRGWMTMTPRSPLPETFVLIYAPRDESDLHVVCKIIEAAIWYTDEERVDLESLIMQP